jgi:hypothetical protein
MVLVFLYMQSELLSLFMLWRQMGVHILSVIRNKELTIDIFTEKI